MVQRVFNFLLLFLVSNHVAWSGSIYLYDTKFMDVPLDHIEAAPNITTFKLRYLINLKFFEKGGPIFAYTGGNHDITNYAENNGFLYDCAVTFKGAVLFIEHRYYGQSLPFGQNSFSSVDTIKYLSTTQALADFAYVISKVKEELVKNSGDIDEDIPVIAFGGNYAGMLAAYLRMKYSHVAQGAIASSPGLLAYPNLSNCSDFYKRVTSVYRKFGQKQCPENIKLIWEIIINMSQTQSGRQFISSKLKLCKEKNLRTQEDVDKLIEWLTNIYTSMSIVNYHSPSTYLGPLPAYPVKVFCDKLNTEHNNDSNVIIQTLGSALEVYTNYTGDKVCNNIHSNTKVFNEFAFKYQSCTELITPRCSTDEDMFVTKPWNLKKYLLDCYNRFEVKPIRVDWGTGMYGGNNLKHYTQLIITSNPRDPMSCETPDMKNSQYKKDFVTLHNFTEDSSMIDLRGLSPADNDIIIKTKKFYMNMIKKWIKNN